MSNTKVTVTFSRLVVDDCAGDTSMIEPNSGNYKGLPPEYITKYEAQDAERLAAYYKGEWHFIGIRAVATIKVAHVCSTTSYQIKSAGLWGIESDSGEGYLNEVYQEECEQLRADIEAMKQAEFKS